MNPHIIDPDTDTRLRALDAAPVGEPIDGQRRASTLTTILASDPGLPAPTPKVAPARGRRALRWVALPGAAAAATAGVLALQGLVGPDQAWASWTPTPEAVSATDLAKVSDACRAQVSDAQPDAQDIPEGVPTPQLDPQALTALVSERRGTWVFVTLTATSSDGVHWSATCLADLPSGSTEDPQDVTIGLAGGGGWAPPQGAELVEGSMSSFAPATGPLAFLPGGPDNPASATDGWVGPDVTGVTIHAGDLTVEATLKDGRYAAWWPGAAFDMPETLPPSGEWAGPPSLVTYDLTLRDGTVIKDAKSTYRDAKTGEVSGPGAAVHSESATG